MILPTAKELVASRLPQIHTKMVSSHARPTDYRSGIGHVMKFAPEMNVIAIIICITYLTKIGLHYKYLGFWSDSDYAGSSGVLDFFMPAKKRSVYMKLNIAFSWFPIPSKDKGEKKLRVAVNLTLILIYLQLFMILVWMIMAS